MIKVVIAGTNVRKCKTGVFYVRVCYVCFYKYSKNKYLYCFKDAKNLSE